YGLGPFLLADDLFYVLADTGKLSLIQADTTEFKLLSQAKVLDANEAWGPMALVDGCLLLRDYTTLVCLQVGESAQ
ncbi:MAG TPA: polyvinylalcohol dehydrogenase, partial [Verrucomicrobiota bacterium]|nr:polyvinylalcohol dehydrogenase [Verrucomicrobiota bacterium]